MSWIAEGYISPEPEAAETWQEDSGSWDNDTTRWNGEGSFSPILEGLLMADYALGEFYAMEYTSGSTPTTYSS
ncbi:hypothetical protein M3M33_14625, partial [Loigolactobacillus coryniformis]|uniref:hypothetical protein n=1 Tax=Loigolactobacillus coryniformis TaxID=1610 RepID=UPI00201B2132